MFHSQFKIDHKQTVLELRDMHDKINFNRGKIQEFERLIPMLVRDTITREIREHYQDIERRKVNVDDFKKLMDDKLDKEQFAELKKSMVTRQMDRDLFNREVQTNIQQIMKDLDKTVKRDTSMQL